MATQPNHTPDDLDDLDVDPAEAVQVTGGSDTPDSNAADPLLPCI